jgi:2-isopropylmalate synthase
MPPERGVLVAVDIYDTTLRDGSQQEGISLTVDDKLHVAEQLDHLGDLFNIESFRVITDWRASDIKLDAGTVPDEGHRLVHPWSSPGDLTTEATVKAHVGKKRVVATAEGNGPVNALDAALRLAIEPHFRELCNVHVTDYRVRVLDTKRGTGAVTRVLLDTADAEGTWSTIGVSENIIEASWQALVDSVVFALIRAAAGEADGAGAGEVKVEK